MTHLEDQVDALLTLCSEMRADVRELRVRHENLESLVKEYARRLNEHTREDAQVSDRITALEVWRARAGGFTAGVLAVGGVLGAAVGALASWLLGR